MIGALVCGLAVLAVLVPLAVGPARAAAAAGSLYAFGLNSRGELGSAINNGTNNPNPTPALVTLPGQRGRITKFAAGGYHSLALTSTG